MPVDANCRGVTYFAISWPAATGAVAAQRFNQLLGNAARSPSVSALSGEDQSAHGLTGKALLCSDTPTLEEAARIPILEASNHAC